MRFIPNNAHTRAQMLKDMGVASAEALFASIPSAARLGRPLALPPGMGETEQMAHLAQLAGANTGADMASFLGAGSYRHFVPLAIDPLVSRAEFLTAYTPYQPEISQGTLRAIFEYQSFMALLTGMDVANASMYDGASAVAEAVLMALRLGKARPRVLVSAGLHPLWRRVLETYVAHLHTPLVTIPLDAKTGQLDAAAVAKEAGDDVACLVVASPNFYGVVEDVEAAGRAVKAKGGLLVVAVAEALSLALLKTPAACGADIVAGEAQSFGISQSYGGPYLGFMACREEHKRQMPGRIAGETVDADGQRGYVLTLSTREQHIRREKATSNICSNQNLMMIRALIHLTLHGRQGLAQAAQMNVSAIAQVKAQVKTLPGYALRHGGAHFNEVALTCPKPAAHVVAVGLKSGVVAGLDVGRFDAKESHTLLVAATEMTTQGEIDRLMTVLKEAAR